MNPIQTFIITELTINKNQPFSKLYEKYIVETMSTDISTSNFTYHINKLLKSKHIKKTNFKYSLDTEGNKIATYLRKGEYTKQPLIVTAVIIKKQNKILTSCSKKQPLDNLWGLSCFGKYSDPVALTKEKTNLDIKDPIFHGVYDIKTTDLNIHHILIVFEAKNPKGELKEQPLREHKWVTRTQLSKLNQFPENEFLIDNKGYHKIERNIEKNEFLLKSI